LGQKNGAMCHGTAAMGFRPGREVQSSLHLKFPGFCNGSDREGKKGKVAAGAL
jgi:hypothetical protein